MTETDAMIAELEAQRAFMGTRAVQHAAKLARAEADAALLREANAEKQKRIAELEARLAASAPDNGSSE